LLEYQEKANETLRHYPRAIAISAKDKSGIAELRDLIKKGLYETYTPISVRLPYEQGNLISIFHESGKIERIEHERGGVLITGRLPGRLIAKFDGWEVLPEDELEIR
jgi:GTP-binding protein HflX